MKTLLILLFITGCATKSIPYNSIHDQSINKIPKDLQDRFKETETSNVQIKPIKLNSENKSNKKNKNKKLKIKELLSTTTDYDLLPNIKVPFTPGEILSYNVKLKGIKIGELNLEIGTKPKYINNHEVFEFSSTLQSTGLVGAIYKINTKITSIVDKNKMFSYKYTVEGQEGSLYKKSYELYDSDNSTSYVYYSDKKNDKVSESNNNYKMQKFPQDLLSIFYYIRTFDLDENFSKSLNITTKDKNKKGIFSVKTTTIIRNRPNWHIVVNLDETDQSNIANKITLWITKDTKELFQIELPTKIGVLSMELKND